MVVVGLKNAQHALNIVPVSPDQWSPLVTRLLVLVWLLTSTLAAVGADVVDVRVWPLVDRTRIEIGLEAPAEHAVFTVAGPDRLVVDLSGARWSDALAKPKLGGRELSALRWAARNQQDLRLVFDLKSPVKLSTAVLPGVEGAGAWLIIEVARSGEPAAAQPERPLIAAQHAADALPAGDPSASAGKPKTEALIGLSSQAVHSRAVASGRSVVIAIDAGHGGVDPGAEGQHGAREKDVTLAVARELKRRIDRERGMRAVLVRDRDVFIPLRKRMEIARAAQADLFVSIHADAFKDARVRGSSVFVLSERGASSEQARWLAERENAADLVGGVALDHPDPMVRSVLLDLAQTGTRAASKRVAGQLLQALSGIGRVHRPEVQQAGFAVLKSPDIPSVLVETAFISNPDEERRLTNRKDQARLADALFTGVKAYFSDYAPPGTLLAAPAPKTPAPSKRGDRIALAP